MLLKTITKIIYDQLVKIKWLENPINLENRKVLELYEKGIVKLDKNFQNFAEYLKFNYIENIISKNSINCPFKIFDNGSDNKSKLVNHFLSIDDTEIKKFILDKDIIFILNSIFNNNLYLRNDPLLQVLKTEDKIFMTNGQFHTDRFMQYSLMLLIEDVSEQITHMEYMETSHKRKPYDLIIHKNFAESQKYIVNNNFTSKKLIGKKGDVFIFNTTGIHRAKYIEKSQRSIFHLNFTNGHNLYPYKIKPVSIITDKIFLRQDKGLKFTDSGWKFFF